MYTNTHKIICIFIISRVKWNAVVFIIQTYFCGNSTFMLPSHVPFTDVLVIFNIFSMDRATFLNNNVKLKDGKVQTAIHVIPTNHLQYSTSTATILQILNEPSPIARQSEPKGFVPRSVNYKNLTKK